MPSKSLAWRMVCLLGFASTICLSVRGQVWISWVMRRLTALGIMTGSGSRVAMVSFTLFSCGECDPIFLDRVVVHFGDGTSEELAVGDRSGQEEETASWASPANLIQSKASSLVLQGALGPQPRVILYGS